MDRITISDRAPPRARRALALSALLCAAALSGCASAKWVSVRDAPANPLSERLMLLSSGGPKPTERTRMYLRRHDLEKDAEGNPRRLVEKVENVVDREPSHDGLAAAAELAYIGGVRAQTMANSAGALNLYGTSVAYSHAYLFHPAFNRFENAYDPQFRGACDLYNASLEAALRIINKQGKLRPGQTIPVEANGRHWDVEIVARNIPWPMDDIERFEFVSDYDINGLKNVFHTYGLGVPLIAVRKTNARPEQPVEKHYPPGLSFPVTAFLRCLPDEPRTGIITASAGQRHRAVLELYDPLQTTETVCDGRRVPLETDITTPLGYTLSDPTFAQLDQPTTGLLFPDRVKKMAGIYMLEPYQQGKIPVLMVHGLWSSPITWMEMFNDLRGDPKLRDKYQFWFYLYPTGQPFWRSATQLREDLVELRGELDPYGRQPALDQMVLVGHSMGGLISHMQIVNSQDDFWRLASNNPIQEVKADEKTKAYINHAFYFQASPSVRRVVTVGTPHRGSNFSNQVTRYLGQRLIALPGMMTARFAQLHRDNPGFFCDTRMLDTATSIDSLSPDSPVLPVLLAAQRPPWIRYHNVVGRLPSNNWQSELFGDGDGVVPYESAHLAGVDSEIEVPADHSTVHRHPQTIAYVREVLRLHLEQLRTYPVIYQQREDRTAAGSGYELGSVK